MHFFHRNALRLRRIRLQKILPSPWPLRHTAETDLTSLSRSLQCTGLIQPPVVRKIGRHYELISGARRLAAARELGWTRLPVLVVRADSAQAVNMATAENLARRDLTPAEEEAARQRLSLLLTHTLREESAFARSLRPARTPTEQGRAAGNPFIPHGQAARSALPPTEQEKTSAAASPAIRHAPPVRPPSQATEQGRAAAKPRQAPSKSVKTARKTAVFPEDADLFPPRANAEVPVPRQALPPQGSEPTLFRGVPSQGSEPAPSLVPTASTAEAAVFASGAAGEPPLRRGVVRESALFLRSARRLMEGLKECGLGDECSCTEEENSLLYTLRIPK